MKPGDKLLFLCARQDFTDAHLKALLELGARTLVWEQVFVTARHHGVAPLVWANLEKAIAAGLAVPAGVMHKFQLSCYQNVVAKRKRAENVANALALLEAHAIEVLALKSVALDLLVYEQPWYTTAADSDLILRPRRHDVSPQALAEISRFFERLPIEYEFYEHHDVTMNGHLPVDFERIWNDARRVSFHGHNLFLMSAEDMLLSLCINSSRKRYFRIRSLVDIAETVNRCRELDWDALFDKARAYQCSQIAYTALVATQATLGCALPATIPDGFRLGPARARAVRRLVPFLVEHLPLAALSYYTGWDLFGRKVGWSLVLPYATDRWRRIGDRIQAAYRASRHSS